MNARTKAASKLDYATGKSFAEKKIENFENRREKP
ncbi:MAG: hypothetical protein OJF59_001895 [Cytophagales bacterium]|jgi:hypothetical protein|nr:MAG: hypothetical protein OJF59_001895 [Cytophagales bacterium]